LTSAFPPPVLKRLQGDLNDNIQRTGGLVRESVAIQHAFQKARLRYSVMKGISLTPLSVPHPELRHQFDLDYLVSVEGAPMARQILEQRGYRLYANKGATWEFKIHESPYVSVRDFYKDLPYRTVELHMEPESKAKESRLDRIVYREMFGVTMPVLSPEDLFLGQAMHAFKDVCNAFVRVSHLLEFYRHVCARRHDDEFWNGLRARDEEDRRCCFGIGIVIGLLTAIMGEFAPRALSVWTADRLPGWAQLWIELYGQRAVFSEHPGTKLYLLLQRELEASGIPAIRPWKKSLLPSQLPTTVVREETGETFTTKLARYKIQVRFVFSRIRFHLVEGLRYAMESRRWGQHLDSQS
jgi:hypothetical protein